MKRWLSKNWREVMLALSFLTIGLMWDEAMSGAFLSGYSARCVTPW